MYVLQYAIAKKGIFCFSQAVSKEVAQPIVDDGVFALWNATQLPPKIDSLKNSETQMAL